MHVSLSLLSGGRAGLQKRGLDQEGPKTKEFSVNLIYVERYLSLGIWEQKQRQNNLVSYVLEYHHQFH